jgi:hypothetical protein
MLGYLLGNNAYGFDRYVPASPAPQPVVTGQLSHVEQRLDALELACAGLWKLLRDKHGYTNEELTTIIHDIDAADGAVDGKMSPQGGVCPHCGHRLLSRTVTKCLWCGAPLATGPFNQSGSGS